MSLDLDDRQRAMLQEMDVHVWWPRTVAPVASAVAPPVALAAVPPAGHVAQSALEKSVSENSVIARPVIARPVAGKTALAAAAQKTSNPENIADNVYFTGATGIKSLHSWTEGIANMTWPALQQAVSTCQACKLCEARKNTVFGVGQAPTDANAAPHADWLIVGEAPGENEDRTGEPFVGQAGQLLDNMLKAIGQERHCNVFIANVIKCRPPGNRNPEPSEVAQCEPYLRRQIELLQPKIILAMGRFAVNSLLQATLPDVHKLPLGKLRGQVHSYVSAGRSVPVIATYHPAYLLRNLPEKAKAWADLCLALEVVAKSA